MSAVPHIGKPLSVRRDLGVLASRAPYSDAYLSWEMERAERTELIPTEETVFASGVACCAVEVEEEDESHLTLARLILACAAGLILWVLIGWVTAPFVAPFIASLQRVST